MASQSDFLVRVASVLGNQRITIPLAADVASLRSEIVKQYGASCRPADVYLSPNRTALSAAYSFAEDLFGANDSIVSELCKRGFQLYAQFPPRSFPKPSEPARSRLHTKASEPQGPLVRKATFKSQQQDARDRRIMRVSVLLHESIRAGSSGVHRASTAVPTRITIELPDLSTCGDLRKAIASKLGCIGSDLLISKPNLGGSDRFAADGDVEARVRATGDALNNPSKRGVLLCDRFPGPQLDRVCELQVRRALVAIDTVADQTALERARLVALDSEAIAIAGGATFQPSAALPASAGTGSVAPAAPSAVATGHKRLVSIHDQKDKLDRQVPLVRGAQPSDMLGVRISATRCRYFEQRFHERRFGYCYGRVAEDGWIEVDTVYEPLQKSFRRMVLPVEDPGLKRADDLAQYLGLQCVGWVYSWMDEGDAYPRGPVMAGELCQAARLQAKHGMQFATIAIKVDKEGRAMSLDVSAASAQMVEGVRRDVFSPSVDNKCILSTVPLRVPHESRAGEDRHTHRAEVEWFTTVMGVRGSPELVPAYRKVDRSKLDDARAAAAGRQRLIASRRRNRRQGGAGAAAAAAGGGNGGKGGAQARGGGGDDGGDSARASLEQLQGWGHRDHDEELPEYVDMGEHTDANTDPLVLAMGLDKTRPYVPRMAERFEPLNRPLLEGGGGTGMDAAAGLIAGCEPQVVKNSKFTISALLANVEDQPWTRTMSDFHLLFALSDPSCSGGTCLRGEELAELALAVQLRDTAHVESFRPKIEVWAELGYRDPIMYAMGQVSGALTEDGLAKACANEHQRDDNFEVVCPLCAVRARTAAARTRKYPPPFAEHIRREHSDLLPDIISGDERHNIRAGHMGGPGRMGIAEMMGMGMGLGMGNRGTSTFRRTQGRNGRSGARGNGSDQHVDGVGPGPGPGSGHESEGDRDRDGGLEASMRRQFARALHAQAAGGGNSEPVDSFFGALGISGGLQGRSTGPGAYESREDREMREAIEASKKLSKAEVGISDAEAEPDHGLAQGTHGTSAVSASSAVGGASNLDPQQAVDEEELDDEMKAAIAASQADDTDAGALHAGAGAGDKSGIVDDTDIGDWGVAGTETPLPVGSSEAEGLGALSAGDQWGGGNKNLEVPSTGADAAAFGSSGSRSGSRSGSGSGSGSASGKAVAEQDDAQPYGPGSPEFEEIKALVGDMDADRITAALVAKSGRLEDAVNLLFG